MARSEKRNTKQEPNSPAFIAYHVPDRKNAFWTKIGAAWDHKDGGGFDRLRLLMKWKETHVR